MIQEIIGILGVSFIALSWIPQAWQTIKTKKSGINLKFGLAQFMGSVFIIIYAWMIKQPLFVILNAIAFVLIAINLNYAFKEKKK